MGNKEGEGSNRLHELAAQVLQQYDVVPQRISVVQGGSIKTVWKVEVQGGRLLCLKRLKQSYDKVFFSVNAQIYVKECRGNVPGIIKNKDYDPITRFQDQLFVLYEWLLGRDLNFGLKEDLELAVKGLASFHIASKGYVAPENARVSSKLEKWPEQYESMRNKFVAWKEAAQNISSLPSCSTYVNCVDEMVDIANEALSLLSQSAYKELSVPGSNAVVLCHQDYGKGNAILTNEGIIVLDLDGVTFELPARDLRKIIGKLAENRGQWEEGTIRTIVDWYCEVNPMSDQEKKVLYIDLLYPHWFYGLVKNQFSKNKPVKSHEIERIARLESSKQELLKKLMGE